MFQDTPINQLETLGAPTFILPLYRSIYLSLCSLFLHFSVFCEKLFSFFKTDIYQFVCLARCGIVSSKFATF